MSTTFQYSSSYILKNLWFRDFYGSEQFLYPLPHDNLVLFHFLLVARAHLTYFLGTSCFVRSIYVGGQTTSITLLSMHSAVSTPSPAGFLISSFLTMFNQTCWCIILLRSSLETIAHISHFFTHPFSLRIFSSTLSIYLCFPCPVLQERDPWYPLRHRSRYMSQALSVTEFLFILRHN